MFQIRVKPSVEDWISDCRGHGEGMNCEKEVQFVGVTDRRLEIEEFQHLEA